MSSSNTNTLSEVTVPAWVRDAVFYQIFPDRFARSERVHKPGHLESWNSAPTTQGFKGGDLLGIAEHLDHLQALGANAIYLNPIFSSASNHRYHTYDYYEVDPLLGGNDALRELIDAAHTRGIRIMLDGVFNHASRGFWPFHHILETGSHSPYLDWFIVNGFPMNAYDERRPPNYAAWMGLPALPKLNIANPDTRSYILDVAEHWIRFGADGWRLDVPNEIDDRGFWQEFRHRVRSANPDAYLVGEIWHISPEWLEGDRFDALMNYPLALTLLEFVGAETLRTDFQPGGFRLQSLSAEEALQRLVYINNCYHPNVVRSQFNVLDTHDTPRFVTMAGDDYSALHLATLLQMTLPGAPSIYYGTEVGLAGGPDPDCRRAFPWDQDAWHQETWDVTRRAVALRHAHGVLRHGAFEPVLGSDGVLAYLRRAEQQGTGDEQRDAILVVVNARRESVKQSLALPAGVAAHRTAEELWLSQAVGEGGGGQGSGEEEVRWSGGTSGDEAAAGLTLELTVPARSGRVLRLD